ncbi:MAG: hypothetical protein A2252_02090 [Elusimicrobia bacterium RIFOXYA2_FULL_39_19]|nr:MAG: hypothetical protein A2252_02090 [Elusimicrobia bacterium RIFOXYA2_FULL_39_19]
MPQYLVLPENIANNKFIIKDSEEFNHLTRVLRVKEGEKIVLFDGAGRQYKAKIEALEKDSISGAVLEETVSQKRKYTVNLYPALINADRFEMLLEKATELGVDSITPVITEHTVIKVSQEKIQSKMLRWQKIMVSAAKQCMIPFIPQVLPAGKFMDLIQKTDKTALNIIAYESEPTENSLKKLLTTYQLTNLSTINLFLGPEGGYTEKEIELAKYNGLKTFSLGKNVLRAETAAIACLSIIHSELSNAPLDSSQVHHVLNDHNLSGGHLKTESFR